MSNQKGYGNLSNDVLDMLVDSTLKKHGVKLEPNKLDDTEKEQLKKMVDNLKKNVEALIESNSKEKKQ